MMKSADIICKQFLRQHRRVAKSGIGSMNGVFFRRSSSGILLSSNNDNKVADSYKMMTSHPVVDGNNNLAKQSRWLSSPAAAAKEQPPALLSVSGGEVVTKMTKEYPHMDVVRYKHKNRKWSFNHVEYYSEALALGFLDAGLQSGDVILSYLPQHLSESMVLQFACSKAGFVLYNLDPLVAAEDPELATNQLSEALKISKANVLVSQEAGNDVNYIRLVEDLIPALTIFDFTEGMPFVTPDYPHLRYPIHTGFDQDKKYGWLPYKHMLIPSNNLNFNLKTLLDGNMPNGKTPLQGRFQFDPVTKMPIGIDNILTNDEVVENKNDDKWETYTKILNQEFHIVEGVGVIF